MEIDIVTQKCFIMMNCVYKWLFGFISSCMGTSLFYYVTLAVSFVLFSEPTLWYMLFSVRVSLAEFFIKEVAINATTTKEEQAVFHDAEKN